MKGYIHIIEIILSFLLILFAISQFSFLYTQETLWSRNYLSLISRDIAYTASFLGSDWQNGSFAADSIKKILFSDVIEYEFGLKNAVKRSTIIGCFCSPAEFDRLKSQLNAFDLNGVKMNFKVLDITGVQDWNSLDAIVYGNYQSMEPDKQKILDFLKNIPEWKYYQGKIIRVFRFPDFHRTMAFVNAVAWMAHQEDHHPDMEVSYNTCTVRYHTHAIRGLSENDFICAAKINALMGF